MNSKDLKRPTKIHDSGIIEISDSRLRITRYPKKSKSKTDTKSVKGETTNVSK